MAKYLGETDITNRVNKYTSYSKTDWIILWLEMYSQIDGEHHKQWLLDQVARISMGTPVIVKIANWSDGQEEERFDLGEASDQYHDWKHGMAAGGLYNYDCGVAP